jgi:hypothetical protein
MMRRPSTTLLLVVTCAALLLAAALAVATAAGTSSGTAAGRDDAASVRSWPLSMTAAPDDMTLAEVSFQKATHGQQLSGSSLQVAVGTPFGDDYLAAGAVRLATASVPRLLVLLVNRPSALLDPVSVHVRLTASAALAQPVVRSLANPLTRAAGAPTPALCELPLHGSPLSASEVRPLHTRGQPLAGFDPAAALAQAYDVVCRLPYASAFKQAVAQPSAPSAPAPPIGKLPGEGCVPAPGYACPAAYRRLARPIAVGG